MDKILQNKENATVHKGNGVSTYNKMFIKVPIEWLVANFYADYYGLITLAPKHWITSGTPGVDAAMILHNEMSLLIFPHNWCLWGVFVLPCQKNPHSTSVGKIYQKRHTILNKLKNVVVTSFPRMKKHKGALWIHQFFSGQVFMQEVDITKEFAVKERFNLLHSNDWSVFLNNSGTNNYGTVLHYTGDKLEE